MNRAALAQPNSVEQSIPQSTGIFQRKLPIGASNDPFEHEADRVADQVLAMPTDSNISSTPPRIQRVSAQTTGRLDSVPDSVNSVLDSSGGQLQSGLRHDMEQRFGQDFSQVRVHIGDAAEQSAQDVNAQAYTAGNHIVFGGGHFAPGTQRGRRLLAHELTHVVQQSGSASRSQVSRKHGLQPKFPAYNSPPATLIQRRRIPGGSGLSAATPKGAAGAAAKTGLARVLSRAWAGLSSAQQSAVQKAVKLIGFKWTNEASLLKQLSAASRIQLIAFAKAIRTIAPAAEMGDPLLFDSLPRSGTDDAAHMTTLVSNANAIFSKIASGSEDSGLIDVFGAASISKVKSRYANAHSRLNHLKKTNMIFVDRSGFGKEVGQGGISGSSQIKVKSSVVDNPSDDISVIGIIHESMHAGNFGVVRDFGYIKQPSFKVLTTAEKLKNAAHYEVVPRRILGASHAFVGKTFVPAGISTQPPLTAREQAIREATESLRFAWTAGLWLHDIFVRVFRTPTNWNTFDLSTISSASAGVHFEDVVPYWSKVEMLTIHTRLSSINPSGGPAVRPVTLIDIALSEGFVRKLDQGMDEIPQTPSEAITFEQKYASESERATASSSIHNKKVLLIKLVIREKLGSITGSVSRDQRVVARMTRLGKRGMSDLLTVRSPSAFP